MDNTFIIAEIGINHNGSIVEAIKMIELAKNAGANAVKFQKREPRLCVPKSQWDIIKSTPDGDMTYIEYKEKMELSRGYYMAINDYCKSIGIKWTASVWDIKSFRFIDSFSVDDVPFIKIPSALLTDNTLLKEVCNTDKHIIISIGMSELAEVEIAVKLLHEHHKTITILHCNSSYPSNPDELDLKFIPVLAQLFPYDHIGYSGHEIGYAPTLAAVAIGAKMVERHVTVDKEQWGTDHKASLDFKEFTDMVKLIRDIEIYLGEPELKVYPSEIISRTKLRPISKEE